MRRGGGTKDKADDFLSIDILVEKRCSMCGLIVVPFHVLSATLAHSSGRINDISSGGVWAESFGGVWVESSVGKLVGLRPSSQDSTSASTIHNW